MLELKQWTRTLTGSSDRCVHGNDTAILKLEDITDLLYAYRSFISNNSVGLYCCGSKLHRPLSSVLVQLPFVSFTAYHTVFLAISKNEWFHCKQLSGTSHLLRSFPRQRCIRRSVLSAVFCLVSMSADETTSADVLFASHLTRTLLTFSDCMTCFSALLWKYARTHAHHYCISVTATM